MLLAGLAIQAPQAVAHTGTAAAVAADYEARLDGVRPAVAGIEAHAVGGDIKLSLTVAPGRDVVVLGILGEPFLRFDDGGVYANRRSPTAAEIRLVHLDTGGVRLPPQWSPLRTGHTFSWHESRLRPVSSGRTGRVAAIAIPLRVDGRPAELVGSSWHAARPAPWPWIAIGLLPVVALACVARFRRAWLDRAVLPVTLIALAATCACVVGRSLRVPYEAPGAYAQIAAAVLLSAVALVALQRVRRETRALLAAGVGALVALFAAGSLSVFVHGFVLSRLPADVDRAGTAVALSSGLCLVGLYGVGLWPGVQRGNRARPDRV